MVIAQTFTNVVCKKRNDNEKRKEKKKTRVGSCKNCNDPYHPLEMSLLEHMVADKLLRTSYNRNKKKKSKNYETWLRDSHEHQPAKQPQHGKHAAPTTNQDLRITKHPAPMDREIFCIGIWTKIWSAFQKRYICREQLRQLVVLLCFND
jgi:hypothetical protein